MEDTSGQRRLPIRPELVDGLGVLLQELADRMKIELIDRCHHVIGGHQFLTPSCLGRKTDTHNRQEQDHSSLHARYFSRYGAGVPFLVVVVDGRLHEFVTVLAFGQEGGGVVIKTAGSVQLLVSPHILTDHRHLPAVGTPAAVFWKLRDFKPFGKGRLFILEHTERPHDVVVRTTEPNHFLVVG